jgi:molybdopterin-synthase adenylyltransferase
MDASLDEADGTALAGRELSVAMPETIHTELSSHLGAYIVEGRLQEDLAFAFWRPSHGRTRTTAVIHRIVVPEPGERILQGNAAFAAEYIQRVLMLAQPGEGIAFAHSHFGPGWQGMSPDDVVAERDRLASAVAGRTGLPLLGLTWGTDGAWSARFWVRQSARVFVRRDAETVRVVGRRLQLTFHPNLLPPPVASAAQVATISVWGEAHQADLARLRVGIVGLGSVGSIVGEALSRIGISRIALIDPDRIEERNLDRTLGAVPEDVDAWTPKVRVAARQIEASHTAQQIAVDPFEGSLLTREGLARVLDCDVLVSCVDRPAPRHVLNAVAYAHLIPVVDGGILARVGGAGALVHADWRIHTVGPGHSCLVCLGALRPEDVALDLAGKLDDPAYLQGLDSAFSPQLARQNVFPFSLSVAAHETLQLIGLVTGEQRIGGVGAQTYHCYPGCMEVAPNEACAPDCEYAALLASTADLSGNCAD